MGVDDYRRPVISRSDHHRTELVELHSRRTAAALDAIHPDAPRPANAPPRDFIATDVRQRPALVRFSDSGDTRSTTLTVHVDPRTLAEHPDEDLALGRRALAQEDSHPPDLNWWIEHLDRSTVNHVAADLGLERGRVLLQMRRRLPVTADADTESPRPTAPPIDTRPFETSDADAWITLNNEAFAWHPDQNGMTRERLDDLISSPWVVAEGLRVLDASPDAPEALDGFCFNRLHSSHDPVLGEIYVVAAASHARGRGIGRALTLDGLSWLHDHGATVAMLYVEADNEPALATYAALGFETHQVNGVIEGPWS